MRRVLTAKMRLGLFESPYVDSHPGESQSSPTQPMPSSRGGPQPGPSCMVTNNGVLPLARNISKVAVIGPAADDRRLLQGDYHYPAHQELTTGPPRQPTGPPVVDGGWPVGGRR